MLWHSDTWNRIEWLGHHFLSQSVSGELLQRQTCLVPTPRDQDQPRIQHKYHCTLAAGHIIFLGSNLNPSQNCRQQRNFTTVILLSLFDRFSLFCQVVFYSALLCVVLFCCGYFCFFFFPLFYSFFFFLSQLKISYLSVFFYLSSLSLSSFISFDFMRLSREWTLSDPSPGSLQSSFAFSFTLSLLSPSVSQNFTDCSLSSSLALFLVDSIHLLILFWSLLMAVPK